MMRRRFGAKCAHPDAADHYQSPLPVLNATRLHRGPRYSLNVAAAGQALLEHDISQSLRGYLKQLAFLGDRH